MKPIVIRHGMTKEAFHALEQEWTIILKRQVRVSDFIQFLPRILQDWSENDIRALTLNELTSLRVPLQHAMNKFKRSH